MNRISQDKLTALLKWYKENGLQPRRKKSGGRVMNKRIISFQDIEGAVKFLLNYAEANAIVLPGRVAAFHRWDIKVLPSSDTRSSVWRAYKQAVTTAGLQTRSKKLCGSGFKPKQNRHGYYFLLNIFIAEKCDERGNGEKLVSKQILGVNKKFLNSSFFLGTDGKLEPPKILGLNKVAFLTRSYEL